MRAVVVGKKKKQQTKSEHVNKTKRNKNTE